MRVVRKDVIFSINLPFVISTGVRNGYAKSSYVGMMPLRASLALMVLPLRTPMRKCCAIYFVSPFLTPVEITDIAVEGSATPVSVILSLSVRVFAFITRCSLYRVINKEEL